MDGSIIDKFNVHEKGAYMFRRLDLSDFVLQHPTISMFHAGLCLYCIPSLLDIYGLKLFFPPPMSAGYESSVAHLLFGDEEYLYIFQEAYASAMHYLYHDPWYVEVNMDSAVN
ncbi:hypothetical protein P8452_02714 [Trifolium repens]|nr:Glycosyl hydrolase family 47 protein [Trifolium repens]WJX12190.1 hypothetical protein P8452_02714 [Trifolium repens]